ncbi:MAG: hypothetical protein R2882_11105 [Gemmatimonadales bacterium]
MAAGKDAGARFADGFALRLGPVARSGFLPALAREFPDLVNRYRRRYAGRQSAGRDYVTALAKRLRTLQAVHGFPVTATATPPAERAAAARAAAAAVPPPPPPNLVLSFA